MSSAFSFYTGFEVNQKKTPFFVSFSFFEYVSAYINESFGELFFSLLKGQ